MTKERNALRISLLGELTIFTAAAIREQLLAGIAGAEEIEVDLSQVTEIDTAGVQLMVAAKREAGLQRKVLSLTGHTPEVLDTLDLCELSAYFGDPVLIHSRG
ncbi:MAG: STAS domain-containing protein [Rhodocyclaceae bacterium]|nr:STAS domain-containing protein [Rhodocyclaceae bacterium]